MAAGRLLERRPFTNRPVASGRGELVILDARDLSTGPVARLSMPAPLPPPSHVGWLDTP